jgi:hypothetical protein
MSMIIDGSLGATFPDASVQAVKAGPTGGGTDRVFQQNNLIVNSIDGWSILRRPDYF